MQFIKKFSLSVKHQLLILLLIAVALNCNTLLNEYAVDDPVVLTANKLVEKGVNGIPEILTTEFFYGLGNGELNLQGGRYRPFTLIIFAIEHQFFGKNPVVSHLINILLFALLIAFLFRLLQVHIFKEQHKYLAFLTCLIFVVHPIHTEVIANVKSRDELITFILLIITSFTFIKYAEKRSLWVLLIGLLCFFLALLTRESAVPFIGIVPLVSYFFFNQSIKKSILYAIPLIVVFTLYLVVRLLVVGFTFSSNLSILNAPFLYASPSEAFATKVFMLFKYCWLLVFPHPLCSDYGYAQLQYVDINSLPFILSFLLIIGLMVYAGITFKRKSLFSFCILYFFITIFLFANFVIDIGAPLSERLLFQPSLAFCIVPVLLFLKAVTRFNALAYSFLIAILLLFSVKTFLRNAEWKNDFTLYSADVITAPNSIRTNMYIAGELIGKADSETNIALKTEYLKKAVEHDEKIRKMYSYYRIYQDLGAAYFGLKDYYNSADNCLQAYNLNNSIPKMKEKIALLSELLYNEGNKSYRMGDIETAIRNYKKSLELNENNSDAWKNLSKSYSKINDTINANEAWGNFLKVESNKFN